MNKPFSAACEQIPHFRRNFILLVLIETDVEIDHGRFRVQHAAGLLAVGDIGDALSDHFAQQQNGAVAVTRMLQRAIDDRSLALDHRLVLQRHDTRDVAV